MVLVLAVCWSGLARAGSTVRVVVSVEPQRWLVEQIGDDRVEIDVLVAPGESPATYQPSDSQITRLMQADLYLRIGVPFERGPWFEAISGIGRLPVVDQRQGIQLAGDDPHIWLSPRLLAIQSRTTADALSRLDPGHRDRFEKNLAELQSRLSRLDERIRQRLEPFAGREFFVFHPSWGYFAAEYGLVQRAIEIEGREPSDQELTVLQKRARQAGATTVFVQPQIHARGAHAFAAVIGAGVETLDPLAADVAANLEVTAGKLERAFAQGPRHGN
jgi:zinc transport system substrate-binding protein